MTMVPEAGYRAGTADRRGIGVRAVAVALFLLLAGGGPASAAPRIFCREPVHEFGKMHNTTLVGHVFVLENRGDRPLVIQRLEPECGCTTTTLTGTVVAPGETVSLSVRLDLQGRKGLQNKGVVVVSDDPGTPHLRLALSGVALAEVEVLPARLEFSGIGMDTVRALPVRVNVSGDRQVRVEGVSADHPFVKVEWRTLEPGRSYELTASTVPPLPPGISRSRLVVRTDHPFYPELILPVMLIVADDVVAVPGVVSIPGKPSGPHRRFVVLRSRSGHAFTVERVEPSLEGITVRVLRTAPWEYRMELGNLHGNGRTDGAVIRVVLGGNGEREMVIPLRTTGR